MQLPLLCSPGLYTPTSNASAASLARCSASGRLSPKLPLLLLCLSTMVGDISNSLDCFSRCNAGDTLKTRVFKLGICPPSTMFLIYSITTYEKKFPHSMCARRISSFSYHPANFRTKCANRRAAGGCSPSWPGGYGGGLALQSQL